MHLMDNAAFSEWFFNNKIFFILIPFFITIVIYFICSIIMKIAFSDTIKYLYELLLIWACVVLFFAVFRVSPDRMLKRLGGGGNNTPVSKHQSNSGNNAQSIRIDTIKHPNWTSLKGTDFELWLQEVYQRRGYNVTHTGGSSYYGADLILQKGGWRIVVQAKGYGNKGRKDAVNEALGAQSYYHANEAWVVTNNYFTDHAINHASGCRIKLYDRNSLQGYLNTGRQWQNHRRR